MKGKLKILLCSLLSVYILYTICRVCFYLIYHDLFEYETTELIYVFWVGMCFDTVAVFYSNAVWLLLCVIPFPIWDNKLVKQLSIGLFVFTNAVFLSINIIDLGYFQFGQRRSGWDLIELIASSKWVIVDYLIDFWYASVLFIAVFVYLIFIVHTLIKRYSTPFRFKYYYLFYSVTITGIGVIGMRGGLYGKPLFTQDAGKFLHGNAIALATNTPHQFISTFGTQKTATLNKLSKEKQTQVFYPYKTPTDSLVMNKQNVVILLLESFDKEYIGYYNPNSNFTPFLDSLIGKSISFDESYANGTASMEAPPAIFASIPSLMQDRYIASIYGTNRNTNIGDLLSKKGYTTSFYHGGANGTMNFDAFIGLSNFGEYFGRNEYPNPDDFDGKWGIFDEPYLQYYAQELNRMPEPFLSSVFTLSSHHPYTVPGKYSNVLPKGAHPILHSVAYTDLALRKFFDTVKQMPWYKNTLFVITADHTSVTTDEKFYNYKGVYCVPIILFKEGIAPQRIANRTVQHQDIMPTVLSYLHYPDKYFTFGSNVLDSTEVHFAVTAQNNYFSMLKHPYLLTSDMNSCEIVNLEAQNVVSEATRIELEELFYAFLQTYQERLRDNKMY